MAPRHRSRTGSVWASIESFVFWHPGLYVFALLGISALVAFITVVVLTIWIA